VIDASGRLVGIFTDGDLRRMVERGKTDFDLPVSAVMGTTRAACRPRTSRSPPPR
jgi:arabinose-5-phosphate isomerase